eukprot:5015283-Amphidinium_carterae.1
MVPKLLKKLTFWGTDFLRPWDWGGVGGRSSVSKRYLSPIEFAEAEAKKAFNEWNKAYEESREKQLEKMA